MIKKPNLADKHDFDIVQENDNQKNEYCRNKQIPLIRIPYSHYSDLKIEDLLLETTTFLVNNADIKSRN